jgi:hypothetical protein
MTSTAHGFLTLDHNRPLQAVHVRTADPRRNGRGRDDGGDGRIDQGEGKLTAGFAHSFNRSRSFRMRPFVTVL